MYDGISGLLLSHPGVDPLFAAFLIAALCIGAPVWLAAGYSLGLQFDAGIGALGRIFSICGPVAVVVAAIFVYRSVMADRSRSAAEAA